jgi:hypothetical protein
MPLSARALSLLASVVALCVATAAPASASERERFDAQASAFQRSATDIPVRDPAPPPGAQVLNYKFGPVKIRPGQNLIDIDVQKERPNVDGWIVGFRPGLVDAKTGKNPPVTKVHLHHAVWLVDFKPTFAAGEEKTNFNAPQGYGWRYTTKQQWMINHMIHDLVATDHEVYITYTLYFIPDTAPEAAGVKEIDTQWMDVEGIKPYPVFDALKGSGRNGRFTYPDDAKNPYPGRPNAPRNEWVADRDATLVVTAGHLHPGGLWTDLNVTRDGRTVRAFRSRANYYEPSGPVSWDVAMSATSPDWRVRIRKGDKLSVSATYDTTRASWYEVMGIMVLGITKEDDGGVDPFTGKVDQTDFLTHGRLPENRDPRGDAAGEPGLLERHPPAAGAVHVTGDDPQLRLLARRPRVARQARPPAVGPAGLEPDVRQPGPAAHDPLPHRDRVRGALQPRQRDQLPAGQRDRAVRLRRARLRPAVNLGGTLPGGDNNIPMTAAIDTPAPDAKCGARTGLMGLIRASCIGKTAWKTPRNLKPATYTYFCRIHPFMRGSFRVVPRKKVRG